MVPPTTPSPQATGGAGTIFEYRFAAVVLAALLRGDAVPGLEVPVEQVGLQQRIAGHPLDDVVAFGSGQHGQPFVEYQVKRKLRPVAGDGDFVAVIQQCLSALDADPEGIHGRRHRLGIAASGPRGPLTELRDLSGLARAHAGLGSFDQALPGARRKVRERHGQLVEAIRSATTADGRSEPTDAELADMAWRLAAALQVWIVEADEGGRDVLEAVNRLRDLVPADSEMRADTLYARLVEVAEAWAPQAGRVDAPMLRAELERRGVALSAAVQQRHQLELLVEASERFLKRIPTTLGRTLSLPRTSLVDRTVDAVRSQHVVLLTGPGGVGKSSLAAIVLRRLRDEGPATIVACSLSGRTGQRLPDLEAEVGVRLGAALRGAPTTGRRLLLIDAAEQSLSDFGTLFLDLLGAAPTDPHRAPSFDILVTSREEAADAVIDFLTQATGQQPQHIPVSDLGDDEIEEVLTAFPRLRPLDRHERPRRLLRRPYLIELLVRATARLDLPDVVVGEEDVVDLVDDRLIRRDRGALPGRGASEARMDVYLSMAQATVANQLPARLDGMDPEARAGLVSDGVLQEIRASYQFSHDVMAEYAVATRLLEPDGYETIASVVAPRRLLRAIRVWMQHRLADGLTRGQVVNEWARMIATAEQLAEADGPRWLDLPFEALLHLGRGREALDALGQVLLADDGAPLVHLLDVTERLGRPRVTVETNSDDPRLDTALCAPVVGFLADHSDEVPDQARAAAPHVTRLYLMATAASDQTEPPSVRIDALSNALVAWTGDDSWGRPFEDTFLGLGLCASQLTEAGRDFLLHHARTRPTDLDVVVEDHRAATALARYQPDLLLRLAGLYYIDVELTLTSAEPRPKRRRESSHGLAAFVEIGGERREMREEGVRRHSHRYYRPSSIFGGLADPSFGPFAALLEASPQRGLRLIGAVVDTATEARIRLEGRREGQESNVELHLPGWADPRRYRGTGQVWMWYRRLGTGPYPAMSALMALREWAEVEISASRPLRDVVNDVLGTGASLAFVAVAYSVLVEHLDAVTEELDSFLAEPLIWDLETARAVSERSQVGPALPIPDAKRLTWTPQEVAIALVLGSDQQGRERLKRVGELLLARHSESPAIAGTSDGPTERPEEEVVVDDPSDDRVLLGRRRAGELDIDTYRFRREGDRIEVMLDYPDEVVQGLQESGGRRSELLLEQTNLAFQAIQIRDAGGDGEADPVVIWSRLHELQAEFEGVVEKGAGALGEGDGMAAAAAAIVLAARHGRPVEDEILASASSVLLEVAEAVGQELLDETSLQGRESAWPYGADRSAAVGLPVLLFDESLRQRADVDIKRIGSAVTYLASSLFEEVRIRLASALQPAWDDACQDRPEVHDAAEAVLRELVASSGMGPWSSPLGYRPRIRLPEPLEETLDTDDLILVPESAADALSGLLAARTLDCPHGSSARGLLDALVRFDLRVWPSEIARHQHTVGGWRGNLDRLTAELTLAGDPSQLRRYLDAFAPVGEDLRGLLGALAAGATTPERAEVLFDVWPEILDTLLPGTRKLDDSEEDRPRPYPRDVHELDAALLPIPPQGSIWPAERAGPLLRRWLEAFPGRPHVADRLMTFLAAFGWLLDPNGTQAVLYVLGDYVRWITHDSNFVIAWLDIVLRRMPSAAGEHAVAARSLLDRLAAEGNEGALRLQRELEV